MPVKLASDWRHFSKPWGTSVGERFEVPEELPASDVDILRRLVFGVQGNNNNKDRATIFLVLFPPPLDSGPGCRNVLRRCRQLCGAEKGGKSRDRVTSASMTQSPKCRPALETLEGPKMRSCPGLFMSFAPFPQIRFRWFCSHHSAAGRPAEHILYPLNSELDTPTRSIPFAGKLWPVPAYLGRLSAQRRELSTSCLYS